MFRARSFSPSRGLALILACGLLPLGAQEGRRGRDRAMPRSEASSARVFQTEGPASTRGGSFGGSSAPGPSRPRITGPAATHRRLVPTYGMASLDPIERCTAIPTPDFWFHRDLMTRIQLEARKGFIPVTAFPTDRAEIQDWSMAGPGWRAYGFLVPPHGIVRLDLEHPKPAWFRVFWIDKWGDVRPGMRVKPGEPKALYQNPTDEIQAVYAIADDPGHWSDRSSPYTLKATRSWDPSRFVPTGIELQDGIWAFDPVAAHFDAEHP